MQEKVHRSDSHSVFEPGLKKVRHMSRQAKKVRDMSHQAEKGDQALATWKEHNDRLTSYHYFEVSKPGVHSCHAISIALHDFQMFTTITIINRCLEQLFHNAPAPPPPPHRVTHSNKEASSWTPVHPV